MNVNVVRRANERRFTKVCATRKQRVEGLEVPVARIVIAAGDVCFQAESWFEQSICKSEPDIGCGRPRLNVSTPEAAELIHELQIVVPARFVSPNSRADRMPEFVSRALVKTSVLSIQTQVVKVNISSRQPGNRGHSVESPKILIWIWVVVKHAGFRSNWFDRESVQLPTAKLQDGLHPVEAEAHIWRFPEGDQPGRAVGKFLPPRSKRQ